MTLTKPTSVWDLMQEGRFKEACAQADNEYSTTRTLHPLRNKLIALLNLGSSSEAVDLGRRIIELDAGKTDSDFIFCGTAYWISGAYDRCIDVWLQADDTEYTDAAGGVEVPMFVYFAGVATSNGKLCELAVRKLNKLTKSARANAWPGPLAKLLIGKIDELGVEASLSSVPAIRIKQVCQQNFFSGVLRFAAGDAVGYRSKLSACADAGTGAMTRAERYLAQYELRAKADGVG